MKKHLWTAVLVMCVAGAALAQDAPKPAPTPAPAETKQPVAQAPAGVAPAPAPAAATAFKTQKEKLSYAFGLSLGVNMRKMEVDVDADLVLKGLKDGVSGGSPAMSEAEIQETISSFQSEMSEKQQKKAQEAAAKNKKDGDAFLSENAKKEGWKKTDSGLQYKVVAEGAGVSPKPEDTVVVHYTGKLVDGTEFDSSLKRNEPLTIPVGGVIKGWSEALLLMRPGAKFQLAIPPEIGYGDRPTGPIPPGSVLLFDVEMLEIKPATAAETTKEGPPPAADAPKSK